MYSRSSMSFRICARLTDRTETMKNQMSGHSGHC